MRVAERAGAEHLGASPYELQPGDEMVFHYHVQREELLIVLAGRLNLRTAHGWEELPEEMLSPSLAANAARMATADAVADYGGKAEIVPPAPGPRGRRRSD